MAGDSAGGWGWRWGRQGWAAVLAWACTAGNVWAGAPGRPVLVDGASGPRAEARPSPNSARDQYWIGVDCRPVSEALRAQLKLAEDEGLVIEQLVPGSPAAAKLQRFDVLRKVDGQVLKSVDELAAAIHKAAGKPIVLEILRGAAAQQVELTAARRPESAGAFDPGQGTPADWEQMLQWLEQARGGEAGQALRFRFFQPGAILPAGASSLPPLPEGMRVTVQKQGSQPAQLEVLQGRQKWQLSEKELEKLPAEVRPHVERLLGRGGVAPGRTFDSVPVLPEQRRGEAAGSPELRGQLEELNRQIRQLRKALDEHNARP